MENNTVVRKQMYISLGVKRAEANSGPSGRLKLPVHSRAAAASYYPIFLDLRGRRCVVTGTGAEMERKARGLLEAGADVTVLAENPSPGLEALADARRIVLQRRPYQEGDLAGVFLAIAATTADRTRSERIAAEARREGVLLNVMDVPDVCVWIAPAIVRRGALTAAISSNGLSPAMTRFVKEEIDRLLPEEYGTLLEILSYLRREIRRRHLHPRPQAWQEALDQETMRLLKAQDWEGVWARVLSRLTAGVAQRDAKHQEME